MTIALVSHETGSTQSNEHESQWAFVLSAPCFVKTPTALRMFSQCHQASWFLESTGLCTYQQTEREHTPMKRHGKPDRSIAELARLFCTEPSDTIFESCARRKSHRAMESLASVMESFHRAMESLTSVMESQHLVQWKVGLYIGVMESWPLQQHVTTTINQHTPHMRR